MGPVQGAPPATTRPCRASPPPPRRLGDVPGPRPVQEGGRSRAGGAGGTTKPPERPRRAAEGEPGQRWSEFSSTPAATWWQKSGAAAVVKEMKRSSSVDLQPHPKIKLQK